MSRAHGAWAISHARRRAQTVRQKAVVAELVAEGWTIAAAAASLGVSQQRGSQIWRLIVEDMGAQAI